MGAQYTTNLGLSQLPELDQSQNPQVYQEFMRMRQAFSALQSYLDNYTGAQPEEQNYWPQTDPAGSVLVQNMSRVYCAADSNFTAGHLVHLVNSGGALHARFANATAGGNQPARAVCGQAVNSGEWGVFYLLGAMHYYSGLTNGVMYYLSETNGLLTPTAPSASGRLVQAVGIALSSSTLWFNPTLLGTVIP